MISSCGQHKKKNKSILSCINEDLTNWEYILAALSILSVVVSIIVIILSVTIPNTGMNTTVTSTKTKQSSSLVSNITGSACSCSNCENIDVYVSCLLHTYYRYCKFNSNYSKLYVHNRLFRYTNRMCIFH